MVSKKVLVVGAGAAGLIAAGEAVKTIIAKQKEEKYE